LKYTEVIIKAFGYRIDVH